MKELERVAIVGGGISGLTTAFWLHRSGVEVTVLESRERTGGTIRTVAEDGWLIETGPNTALETTPLLQEMFDALGIAGDRLYANPAADKRYILRGGKLHALPMTPGAFLSSSLWSVRGKLRLLKEPFIGRGDGDETVAEFVTRRLGREFLDYAINPFVAGVFAGNPEELSVRSAFPRLFALEEQYGGLFKGMLLGARQRRKRAEKAKDRAKMFTFRRGMQTFPDAIASVLGSRVHPGSRVTSVFRSPAGDDDGRSRFLVACESNGHTMSVEADAVVLAVPAYVSSSLLEPFAPSLARMLAEVYYPPVAEVFLGFRTAQIRRGLDGFGYLIPALEARNTLGTIWTSSLFPGRAPAGHVALTTFVGGARAPHLVAANEAELERLVVDDLRSIMGLEGSPVFSKIVKWDRAIPQYTRGYGRITEAIESFEAGEPGFFLCSNFRGGIAVGDCVMNGRKVAERILTGISQDNRSTRRESHAIE